MSQQRLPSIFDQLRQANAYIDKLETQVREITTVVTTLKSERAPISSNSDPLAIQNAWNLARHVLAVIPTIPSTNKDPPSLSSLSLALEFTREMDRLVGNRKSDMRRDEDIFTEENLEKVKGRLQSWERVVRGEKK